MNILKSRFIKAVYIFLALTFLAGLTLYSFTRIETTRKSVKYKLASLLRDSSLKPEFLKFADLNFDTMTSDYFWVLFIQEVSDFKLAKIHYPYMYKICNIAVTLNPRFNYAYEAGGTMLGLVGKPKQAIKLLKIGMKHMDGNWNIPFLISFNYFYNIGNFKKAAYYLKYALDTKGSPKYLEFLYMKLLNKSGNLEGALNFLEDMYNNNKNPVIRKIIKYRINAVKKELKLESHHIGYKIPYSLKLFMRKKRSKK